MRRQHLSHHLGPGPAAREVVAVGLGVVGEDSVLRGGAGPLLDQEEEEEKEEKEEKEEGGGGRAQQRREGGRNSRDGAAHVRPDRCMCSLAVPVAIASSAN